MEIREDAKKERSEWEIEQGRKQGKDWVALDDFGVIQSLLSMVLYVKK